jgi:hypothetical protein
MECFCYRKETFELKIEGDVGADPIWCNKCGCNLDLENFAISENLKNELMSWALTYGEWIDWEKDKLIPNGLALEVHHNNRGRALTEKLKKEVDTLYTVTFSPSSTGRSYLNKQ